MSPNCVLCGVPFRTGDRARPASGGAAHQDPCPVPGFRREYSSPPTVEAVEQASAALHGVGVATARALPEIIPKFDSKLERLYWFHLQSRLKIGEIRRVDCHPEKLLLGEGAWYTPDFRVVALDGVIEHHECKGFMREAANVRLKVAASLHPFRFFLVRNTGSSSAPRWDITRIGSSTD